MNAQRIFKEMKRFVDSACNAKNYRLAVEAAERLGFHSFPTGGLSQMFADLKYNDSSGGEVRLVVKWHDPSGPYQNLPDINRIRLKLTAPSQSPMEHMREYED